MNGRKAKVARALAAELREAGFDAPRRARRLRPWLDRHYALQARPATVSVPRPPWPPAVPEYQPLGSRKVGRPGGRQPARARPGDVRGDARQGRQTRRAGWRARQQRRRERQDRKAA